MSETNSLSFQITVQASAEIVYEAWTNDAIIPQWMCNDAKVQNQADGAIFLRWNNPNYYMMGEFTTLTPNETIEFTWLGRGEPAATAVHVSLSEQDGATQVDVTHSGIGSGDEWAATKEAIQQGWDYCLPNLKQVLEEGKDRRIFDQPFLGVFIAGLVSAEEAESLGWDVAGGVRISGTFEGTGAAAAGLQLDDVIIGIGDVEVVNFQSIQASVAPYKAGETAPVTIMRDGEKHVVDMLFSSRPAPVMPKNSAEFANQYREIFERVLVEFENSTASISEEEACYKPSPTDWTIKDHLAHCIVTERGSHMMVASVCSGQRLTGWPFNPDFWNKLLTDTYTFEQMAALWKDTATESIALLAAMPDSVFEKKGVLFGLTQNYLGGFELHTQAHIRDIQAIVEQARQAMSVPA